MKSFAFIWLEGRDTKAGGYFMAARNAASSLLFWIPLGCFSILVGALSGIGCLLLLVLKESRIAFYGAILSAVAVTALFFGQRIAKEYAGAAVLIPYFLLTLVAIYLLAPA